MADQLDRVGSEESSHPTASVIVVTRDRADSLARALNALRNLDYPNYQIVVVDNDSRDHTRHVIEQYQAEYVFVPSKHGIAFCRQMGVQAATGEIIAFCDDDCVPSVRWLTHMVRRLSAEPDLGALGGRVINVGFPEKNGYADPKRYKGRSKLGINGKLILVEDLEQVEFFGNANLGFRSELIRKVGGYDPFFNTMAEIDLETRIRKLGYRIDFEPEAVLEHHYTGKNYKKRQFFYGPHLVRLYFCMKHFRPKTASEWFRFMGYELQFLVRDLIRVCKKFLSAVKKGNMDRLSSISVEAFNMVTARLAIPWLLWRIRTTAQRQAPLEA